MRLLSFKKEHVVLGNNHDNDDDSSHSNRAPLSIKCWHYGCSIINYIYYLLSIILCRSLLSDEQTEAQRVNFLSLSFIHELVVSIVLNTAMGWC